MKRRLNTSSIGTNIRILREGKGWSQNKLAKESSIPQSVICKIEKSNNPNPKISTLLQIALALNTTISELVENYNTKIKCPPHLAG